jgi:hypothetical protein
VRRRRAIAGIVGALVLALPTTALANSLDSSSTSKFVAATSGAVHAELAGQGKLEAAVNALISHVQSGCPGAVPASLKTGTAAQRRTAEALSFEAGAELTLALIDPVRSAEQRAIRVIAPLRWTSATLNGEVSAFVRQGRAALALHPPDICAQAKAAAVSGFAVVPPATTTFLRHYGAALPSSAPTAIDLADKMKPLADAQGPVAIGQLASLEGRVSHALGHFTFSALDRLSRALSS